jgi:hypothetical protein
MQFLQPFLAPRPQSPFIRFGNVLFSDPEPLTDATLADIVLSTAGLYAIMVYDAGWSPLPYRPLYFGESDNIRTRATRTHENYASWKREGGTATLYRAFHSMPGSNRTQRQAVESALIAHYNTPCNERLSFNFGGRLGRI